MSIIPLSRKLPFQKLSLNFADSLSTYVCSSYQAEYITESFFFFPQIAALSSPCLIFTFPKDETAI